MTCSTSSLSSELVLASSSESSSVVSSSVSSSSSSPSSVWSSPLRLERLSPYLPEDEEVVELERKAWEDEEGLDGARDAAAEKRTRRMEDEESESVDEAWGRWGMNGGRDS